MRSEATGYPCENVYKAEILAFPSPLWRILTFILHPRGDFPHSLNGARGSGAYSAATRCCCATLNIASLEAWNTRSPKAGRIASRWSNTSDCVPS